MFSYLSRNLISIDVAAKRAGVSNSRHIRKTEHIYKKKSYYYRKIYLRMTSIGFDGIQFCPTWRMSRISRIWYSISGRGDRTTLPVVVVLADPGSVRSGFQSSLVCCWSDGRKGHSEWAVSCNKKRVLWIRINLTLWVSRAFHVTK